MLLLALDTSTPAVTVALHDGGAVVAESTTVDARRHAELLAPAVAEVLAHAGAVPLDVTEVAVGVGPGPFTGLRVGVAAARTLGAALGMPVRGVCSLDVIAYRVVRDGASSGSSFLVATDARRREVYWASYDASGNRAYGPEVGAAADIAPKAPVPGDWAELGALPAAGAGAKAYRDAFAAVLEPEYPFASDLACSVVEGAVPTVAAEPVYLRRPDATPPKDRKSVLA